MRLSGFTFLFEDAVDIRVAPAFGDHLGAREFPRLGNPVVRLVGSIVIVTRLSAAMPRRASSAAIRPAVLSMNSGGAFLVIFAL
jgi:hypothetical protein